MRRYFFVDLDFLNCVVLRIISGLINLSDPRIRVTPGASYCTLKKCMSAMAAYIANSRSAESNGEPAFFLVPCPQQLT